MKKLLLLAVLALGVVACDKNELGDMDSMSINPIDAKVEMSAKARWEYLVNHIVNTPISDDKKVSSVTKKGGDNGPNWVEAAWFYGADSDNFVYLRPDDLGNGCYDNIASGISSDLVETYSLVDVSGVLHLNVQTGDQASGETFQAAIPTGTDFAFNLFFNDTSSSLYFAQNNFLGWNIIAGNLPSATVND